MEQRFRKEIPEEKDAKKADVPETEQPLLTDIADFLKGTETALPLAIILIFLMLFVGFLYFAKPFLIPVMLAVILSFLLKPAVKFLHRIKIPNWIGSLIVMAAFFSVIWFIFSQLVQPTKEWVTQAPENIRKIEQKFRRYTEPARHLAQPIAPAGQEEEAAQKIDVQKTAGTVFDYASSFLATAVEVLVLLYFLLSTGDMFTQKLVKVLPTRRDKKKAVSIVHEVQNNISVYLFTITCINACLGALLGFALMLMGMPNPLLWGVMAALLNFVPYFGPLTGMTILGIAGLVTFNFVGQGLLPPAIYLCLHGLESNFFPPLIIGKRLTLNPVVIFGSIIFWMWLWGIPGAVIAVPLLMMIKIFCDYFKPLAAIGQFLGEADGD